MLSSLRDRLTYANVVATLALFVALGGSSYAAIKIGAHNIKTGAVGTRAIKNNTVRSTDIRNGTLTGTDINESRLGTVPRARSADTLGGLSASQLRVRCPAGTALAGAGCFELAARAPTVYAAAGQTCRIANRRLPTATELLGLFQNQVPGLGAFSPGGEFTANASEVGGTLRGLVMKDAAGGTWESLPTTGGNNRQYRCVALPLN